MEITILAISSLAIFLGFFVQTITGFAAGLVAAPILLIIFDLPETIALLSIFFLIFSAIQLPKEWKNINKPIIKEIFLSILVGLILGIFLLKHADVIVLKKSFGFFIILYVIYSFFKDKKIKILKKLGILFGFLGGFTSGVYSGGGIFFVPYINNKLDNTKNIRATIIGALAIGNFLRVPLIIQNGILTYDIFLKSIFIMPFFLASLYLGQKFYKKLEKNKQAFQRVLLLLLFLSGLSLIIS